VYTLKAAIAVIDIDISKNSFTPLASISAVQLCCARSGRMAKWKHALPTCLIGMEACVGDHLSRKVNALRHDAQ
jgi:hypothetical protein